MEYRIIAMHAVSRDPEIAPRDCIYIQLDSPSDDDPRFNEEAANGEGNSEEAGEEVEPELKIIPSQREIGQLLCFVIGAVATAQQRALFQQMSLLKLEEVAAACHPREFVCQSVLRCEVQVASSQLQ